MASFKKKGQCNIVRIGQIWKNKYTGRVCKVLKKGKGGKNWIVDSGSDSHHINEGTLLKFFEMVNK